MTTKKKKLTGQQGELMRALDITPDDLMANDEGIITANQRETVVKRQHYQWLPVQILAGVLGLMGIIFPLVIQWQDTSDTDIAIILAMIFLTIAGGLTLLQYALQRRLSNELNNNVVETTQGIAVVNVGEDSSHLEINGMKLKASPDVLRRIRHLDPYIIHYLPGTKVILSMEHIPEDDNIRQDIAANRLRDDISDADYNIIDDHQQSQSVSG